MSALSGPQGHSHTQRKPLFMILYISQENQAQFEVQEASQTYQHSLNFESITLHLCSSLLMCTFMKLEELQIC